METGGRSVGITLALSTFVAALFVAVQAWYARVAYVEAERNRLLEKKLEICFENFDAAVDLDAVLRELAPGIGMSEVWPPRIESLTAPQLFEIQSRVIPMLNRLQSSLAKASILGMDDRFRIYLSGQLDGLNADLQNLSPAQVEAPDGAQEVEATLKRLSEFFNAQHSVFEGCRLIASGDA